MTNIQSEREKSMNYDFPLRKNLIIQFFNIPTDLTKNEAKRISKCIKCLAINKPN